MKSRPTNGQRRMTLLKQTHAATIMYPPYIHVHVHVHVHVKCGSDNNSLIHCSIQNNYTYPHARPSSYLFAGRLTPAARVEVQVITHRVFSR